MMKVAVVGAGAAGLCCARHLSRYQDHFQFQVLERMAMVGGTWVYSPIQEAPPSASDPLCQGVHSSMYKNLRTNLPKEVMFFPGFPFPSHLRSFIHNSKVLQYLQDYASCYDLNKFIKFGTVVEQVVPISTKNTECASLESNSDVTTREDEISFHNWGRFTDTVKWRVTTKDVETGQRTSEEYDAIFVCNGHFSAPDVPTLPGLSHFPGQVIHSHLYRVPEAFKDQNVMVVGSGQSGRDIILDLSTHAKRVYMSNRGPMLASSLPGNVEQLPGIADIGSDGKVYFTDGQERHVDRIILATGYVYSFPFLSEGCGVEIKDGKRVYPLYKHTINPTHPSMAFIGINFGYNPFPYFDYQVRWVLSVWAAYKTLPSIEDMIKDDDDSYQNRLQAGLPPHKASHFLGPAQWDMIVLLAEMGGNTPLAPVMKMLYDETSHKRNTELMKYRSNNFVILGEDKWALANET